MAQFFDDLMVVSWEIKVYDKSDVLQAIFVFPDFDEAKWFKEYTADHTEKVGKVKCRTRVAKRFERPTNDDFDEKPKFQYEMDYYRWLRGT